MATILDFTAQDRPQRHRAKAGHEAPAEIVLFPGVRYERWAEAPKAPKQRSRRARDTIDLHD